MPDSPFDRTGAAGFPRPAAAPDPGIAAAAAELRRCEAVARDRWDARFPAPAVSWTLRGHRAGECRGYAEIRLNPDLCCRHPEAVAGIVAHEYAHAVVAWLGRGRWRRPRARWRPHGSLWADVIASFGYPPERTHRLHSVASRTLRRFGYRCPCRLHALTSVRHRRVQAGTVYRCRACRGALAPVHGEDGTAGELPVRRLRVHGPGWDGIAVQHRIAGEWISAAADTPRLGFLLEAGPEPAEARLARRGLAWSEEPG